MAPPPRACRRPQEGRGEPQIAQGDCNTDTAAVGTAPGAAFNTGSDGRQQHPPPAAGDPPEPPAITVTSDVCHRWPAASSDHVISPIPRRRRRLRSSCGPVASLSGQSERALLIPVRVNSDLTRHQRTSTSAPPRHHIGIGTAWLFTLRPS